MKRLKNNMLAKGAIGIGATDNGASAAKLILAATLVTLLSGCQTVQLPNFKSAPGPGPTMPPAQLPNFTVGDKYYYSNGAREQVISVEGEAVNMISASKRKLTNFRNFVLPQPYIEGATKEYFKNTNAPTTLMWPLSVGASARVNSDGRSGTKASRRTTQ